MTATRNWTDDKLDRELAFLDPERPKDWPEAEAWWDAVQAEARARGAGATVDDGELLTEDKP